MKAIHESLSLRLRYEASGIKPDPRIPTSNARIGALAFQAEGRGFDLIRSVAIYNPDSSTPPMKGGTSARGGLVAASSTDHRKQVCAAAIPFRGLDISFNATQRNSPYELDAV